jgi:hypothetical protein
MFYLLVFSKITSINIFKFSDFRNIFSGLVLDLLKLIF